MPEISDVIKFSGLAKEIFSRNRAIASTSEK